MTAAVLSAGALAVSAPPAAGAAAAPGGSRVVAAGAVRAVAGSARVAGPVSRLSPGRAPAVAADVKHHDFGRFGAAKFLSCKGHAKITGHFRLNVSGVKVHFRKWKKKDKGSYFKASLGWKTTIGAAVRVSARTTCRPGKALKKIAATFVIYGVKVKLRPDFELKISGQGKITAAQTTSQSVTVHGHLGLALPKVTHTITPGKPKVTASGSGRFDALIGAEADITAGVVGLDFQLLGGLHATAKAKSSPAGVCVHGYPELMATGKIRAQFFRWHQGKEFLNHTWPVRSVAHHSTVFTLCTYTPPKIITTRLPGATAGQPYRAQLTTADHRKGTWKITAGKLPAGLALSGYTISGTPATAGTYAFKVKFTDTRGKTATATVTVKVGTGVSWTAAQAQVPGNWPALANTVPDSVSCPTAAFCAAVGTDNGPYNAIWFRKGGTWTAGEAIPLPTDAGPPPGGSGPYVALSAVSCPSASLCVVVGYYYNSSGVDMPLVMTWADGSWQQEKIPLPSNGGGQYGLTGVSCPTTAYCVAVGTYENTASFPQGMLLTWSGGSWTVAEAPVPGNAAPDSSALYAVSCASASSCTAVGSYSDTSGTIHYMVVTFSGGSWTPQEAPASPPSGGPPQINAMSCPSASFCAVVGDYQDASGDPRGLLMTKSGGKWTAATAPVPSTAPGGYPVFEHAVSCVSAQSCAIGGSYNNASGTEQHDDLLTLSGGAWMGGNVPAPSNSATGEGSVLAVSCWSASSCVAVGDYEDASTQGIDGLLLTSSG